MKFGLIGGVDIKKYTIADFVWKNISSLYGIGFDFEIIPIEDFIELCRFYWNFLENSDFIGFNIALPWKTDILKLVENNTRDEAEFHAINVIYKNNNKIHISNTDIIGIERSLLDITNIDKKDILILGAGGAGLPTAKYLAKKYCCNTYLYDLKKIKVEYDNIKILDKYNDISQNKYDIIINATPVGKYYFDQQPSSFSTPISLDEFNAIIKSDTIVQEMNYFPHTTQLLKFGLDNNLEVISGIKMLVYQALESFKLYTDIKLDDSLNDTLFSEITKIAIKKENELF